ncbi:MAG: single-stranded DNA-binding protein [Myxococcota bacterium]
MFSLRMNLLSLYDQLRRDMRQLRFAAPVTHVYNPLEYAFEPYVDYLRLCGEAKGRIVLLGMNPGPWGMAQTGVPFGEVSLVRDWLGITGNVRKPKIEHPKRPVMGFACARSEVSGARVWGWAQGQFKTPTRFFKQFFVANYCPLVFMEDSGRNRTPDKLPRDERTALTALCDAALRDLARVLEPRWVIGIGKFAEDRARDALAELDVPIGRILHPSPASPLANKGWADQAMKQLQALGIAL